jgi:hypothetical protein
MVIRVLTAWVGSPPCGAVADLPDLEAARAIGLGDAEAVVPTRATAPASATVAPHERAVSVVKGRTR